LSGKNYDWPERMHFHFHLTTFNGNGNSDIIMYYIFKNFSIKYNSMQRLDLTQINQLSSLNWVNKVKERIKLIQPNKIYILSVTLPEWSEIIPDSTPLLHSGFNSNKVVLHVRRHFSDIVPIFFHYLFHLIITNLIKVFIKSSNGYERLWRIKYNHFICHLL
jgi:hypothetical protein